MKVECPRCHTRVEKPLQGDPVCPTCGFGSAGGAPPTASPPPLSSPAASPPGPGATPSAGWSTSPPPAGPTWSVEGAPMAQPPRQGMAITALVLGIVGCCLLGPLAGIPAAILGGIALNRAKKDPQNYGGQGMALTGLILGIVATVAGIIAIVFYAAVFAAIIDGLPPECWDDPDSAECERALDEQDQAGARTALLAAPFLPAAPVTARRLFVPQWHAG